MSVLELIPFAFDEQNYEVRVERLASEIKVRVYVAGKPANPWSYSVDLSVADDFALEYGEPAWKHLVEVAMHDVVSRKLDKLLANLKEEQNQQPKNP